tara:strand:+ start:849 stop:1127 length:279 start_codon:yes stop_codon:yes gene_type:complete
MNSFLNLIDSLISLYIWALILSAVLSWLIAFNIVNTSNQFVYTVTNFLYKVTDPLLKPIRNLLPNFGGVDISPVILILLLVFLRGLLFETLS